MGVRIIESRDGKMAAIYCSTVDVAFGPVFYSREHADAGERALAFLKWLHQDSRLLTDSELMEKYSEWLGVEEAKTA